MWKERLGTCPSLKCFTSGQCQSAQIQVLLRFTAQNALTSSSGHCLALKVIGADFGKFVPQVARLGLGLVANAWAAGGLKLGG